MGTGLSPDSLGAICLNRDVINQDGCSKPQARIRGAVRRQACWCTGSHNLWAVSVTTRKIHQINHTLNFFSFKTLFHRGAHLILNPKPLPEIFRRPDTRLHSSFHSFSADRTSLFFPHRPSPSSPRISLLFLSPPPCRAHPSAAWPLAPRVPTSP